MAWPYDARLTEFAASSQVPSATLNAIQDRIVDLFTDRSLVEVEGFSSVKGTDYNVPCWVRDWVDPSRGWAAVALQASGDSPLIFDIRAKVGMVIKGMHIKYYNGHAANTSDNEFNLYRPNINTDTSTDAPVLGASIATGVTSKPASAWSVVSMGTLSVTIAADERLTLVLDYPMQIGDLGASPGDAVAGIRCIIQPLTVGS